MKRSPFADPELPRWLPVTCDGAGCEEIVHVREDVASQRPILCGSCGYEKEFGTMPKGKEESKTNGHAPTKAPKDMPKGAVERNRYDEKLPCKTDAEVTTAKALELAKLEHQRTAFREAWKAQCAKARERRAYFEERIEELANEVDGQVEYRNVQVVEYLLPTNEVMVVRGDTGEVIETRAADADDLQETIPGAVLDGAETTP
jgi:hypothetical protein